MVSQPLQVLSWGCGVQSTTLAAMSALGDLPRLDLVIHADLEWERAITYQIHDWYTTWLENHGIQVITIKPGNIQEMGAAQHIHIPFWTETGGPLQRQCTQEFKINPIRRAVRQYLGCHPSTAPAPPPGTVQQWIGISLDEHHRAKPTRIQYMTNQYPLLQRQLTRQDCIEYLQAHNLPVPIKSACIGCPYRSADEWLDMYHNAPDEWQQALIFDQANRHNPLAGNGTTADRLYIYRDNAKPHPEPLHTADLQRHAQALLDRRRHRQLPLLIPEAPAW